MLCAQQTTSNQNRYCLHHACFTMGFQTNYDDDSLKLAFDTVSASFGINAENCAEVLTEVMRERRKTIIAYVLGVSKTLSPTTNGPTGIAAEKRRRVQASRGGHMVEQDLTRRSSPSSQSTSSLLTRSASCKRQRAIANMSPILEPAQASSSDQRCKNNDTHTHMLHGRNHGPRLASYCVPCERQPMTGTQRTFKCKKKI